MKGIPKQRTCSHCFFLIEGSYAVFGKGEYHILCIKARNVFVTHINFFHRDGSPIPFESAAKQFFGEDHAPVSTS